MAMDILIKYEDTDLSDCVDRTRRIVGGVFMAVTAGRAVVATGAERYELTARSELTLTGGWLRVEEKSDDFRARMFSYSLELLAKIALPIDNRYFDYNAAHPLYRHTDDARSRRTWRETLHWMDLCRMLFGGEGTAPQFPQLQAENFLQGFWMWNFSTIQERLDVEDGFSQTRRLAHRFIRLVKEHAREHHRVADYANLLNISPRYLNTVVARHTLGKTPKLIIDSRLVADIKEQLTHTTLSLSQIADLLNFPDQSYLSRFFHRHTGLYPRAYRANR